MLRAYAPCAGRAACAAVQEHRKKKGDLSAYTPVEPYARAAREGAC